MKLYAIQNTKTKEYIEYMGVILVKETKDSLYNFVNTHKIPLRSMDTQHLEVIEFVPHNLIKCKN